MTKAQISAMIIERSTFYGSKTVKRLNRWFKKNHDGVLGHSKLEGAVAVKKAVKELDAYKKEKVKTLMRMSKKDLIRMSRFMSAKELERRYGTNHIDEGSLPDIVLDVDRELKVEKSEIQQWVKESKKKKLKKAAETKEPEKVKRKKVSTSAYVANILRFNSKMHTTNAVAGIDG